MGRLPRLKPVGATLPGPHFFVSTAPKENSGIPEKMDRPLDWIRPGSADREWAEPIMEHLAVPPFPNQHEEWLQHIHEGTQPQLSNIRTARHVMEVFLAAQESSQTGTPVTVESAPGQK